MTLTEQGARNRALRDLCQILVREDAPPQLQDRAPRDLSDTRALEPLVVSLRGLFSAQTQNPSASSNSVMIRYLLAGGLVDLLVGILVDFAPLNRRKSLSNFMNSTWFQSLDLLNIIGGVYPRQHRQEASNICTIWMKHLIPLMRIFTSPESNPFLTQCEDAEAHQYSTCVFTIIGVLSPVFAPPGFSYIGFPEPTSEMCELAVILLAKVQKFLAITPASPQFGGILTYSGQAFAYAVDHLIKTRGRWDLASAAGLSYSELFGHCKCICILNDAIDMISPDLRATSRIAQLNLMARILKIDPSQSCMAAWESRKVITWSVEVVRTTLALPLFARELDSRLPSRTADWYDEVMITWADSIRITAANHFSGPAVEALECDVLFIIEAWSADAVDSQLGWLTPVLINWDKVLDTVEPMYKETFIQQLRIISSRMASKASIRSHLAQHWKTNYTRFNFTAPLLKRADVCGATGCSSRQGPTMQCARCRNRYYCNRTCQKGDWKMHKAECSRKT